MADDTQFEDGSLGTTTGVAVVPAPAGAHADTSSGKHAMILVPDFEGKGTAGKAMNSYLRLGAAHTDAGVKTRTDLGEDLAALVNGFTDDLRARGGGGAEHSPLLTRSTPPNADETSLYTPEARRAESAILHSKGGWRDHSDGNRITTTRGDKIEVIRGNYKLLVLGRSAPPISPTEGWDNVTGMELAGGNVDTSGADLAFGMNHEDDPVVATLDRSRTFDLETVYEWHQDLDQHWAWRQTTNVGSKDVPPGNNQIISNTWVDYQETNLGSAERPVQGILSTTFVNTMTQTTTVNTDFTSTTTVGQAFNQATNAENMTNATSVGDQLTTTTTAGKITTATAAFSQVTAQALAANFVANLIGMSAEFDVATMLATIQVTLSSFNLLISPLMMDDHVGTHVDMHPGMHVDHHSGIHFDVHDGFHPSIDAHPLAMTGNSIEVSAGKVLTIADHHVVTTGMTFNATEQAIIDAAEQHMKL